MAAEPGATRIGIITGALTAAMTVAVFCLAYPQVPRGILIWAVVLVGALPLWAAVRAIDRMVSGGPAFARLPNVVRVAIVAVSSGVVGFAIFWLGLGWLIGKHG